RSGGSTGFGYSGMTRRPSPSRPSRPSATSSSSLAGAFCSVSGTEPRERRKPFAEARRRERQGEGLAHLGDLAAPQRAPPFEQRVPLRVDALAEEEELAFARGELRLLRRERLLAPLDRVD